MDTVVMAMLVALITAWNGVGAVVIAHGTPLGVALYAPAIAATNPRMP